MRVKVGLSSQGLNSGGIEFNSAEHGLSVVLGCVLEGIGCFEPRDEEAEVCGES